MTSCTRLTTLFVLSDSRWFEEVGVEYKIVVRNITVAIDYLFLVLLTSVTPTVIVSESVSTASLSLLPTLPSPLVQVPSSTTVVTPVLSSERSPVI
jgi:hypothetical protein